MFRPKMAVHEKTQPTHPICKYYKPLCHVLASDMSVNATNLTPTRFPEWCFIVSPVPHTTHPHYWSPLHYFNVEQFSVWIQPNSGEEHWYTVRHKNMNLFLNISKGDVSITFPGLCLYSGALLVNCCILAPVSLQMSPLCSDWLVSRSCPSADFCQLGRLHKQTVVVWFHFFFSFFTRNINL